MQKKAFSYTVVYLREVNKVFNFVVKLYIKYSTENYTKLYYTLIQSFYYRNQLLIWISLKRIKYRNKIKNQILILQGMFSDSSYVNVETNI